MTGYVLRLAATILLVTTACTSTPEDAVTTTEGSQQAFRYLALGDSYTIGESVEPDERWPVQLARQLENSGFSLVDVQIVARTGWTTSELAQGVDGADPVGPFDLVTLLIGVNNQFRGLGLDEYRAEFEALVDRAIGFAGGDPSRVIVVSIPDWGVTPFAAGYPSDVIATEIDAFNDVGEAGAIRAGTHWVDITAISRSGQPELAADDGLHPSGAQYQEWVSLILPVALQAVG